MQEIEYISCIYHMTLFSKESRLNSTHYLRKKIDKVDIKLPKTQMSKIIQSGDFS